jgi:hypothetical protein
MDYWFIGDPPTIADIGTAEIVLSGLCLSFEVTSDYIFQANDNEFTITVSELKLDWLDTTPLVDIDGYSDFSQVVNGTINILGSVVKNRLSSLINNEQVLVNKINKFLGKVTSHIPSEIDIGANLYLYGWLYESITTKPDYVAYPLKVALKSDLQEYTGSCGDSLPTYTTRGTKRYPF